MVKVGSGADGNSNPLAWPFITPTDRKRAFCVPIAAHSAFKRLNGVTKWGYNFSHPSQGVSIDHTNKTDRCIDVLEGPTYLTSGRSEAVFQAMFNGRFRPIVFSTTWADTYHPNIATCNFS